MYAQFLSDGSDFRSRGGGQLAARRRGKSMFWWTILITLLVGVATFSWIFSIMVFTFPEKPFNYKLLTKLKKLDALTEFDPLRVPRGDFQSAKDLLRYSDLTRGQQFSSEQLKFINAQWKRSYITNYKDKAPDYVKGTFTVVSARQLNEKDVMSDGWVVRGRAADLDDVEVELLLPGAQNVESPFKDGESFTLDNKSTFAAILNVQRSDNDGVCATVIPIVYGENVANGEQKVALEVPEKLNMEASWPLTEAGAVIPSAAKVAKAIPVQ